MIRRAIAAALSVALMLLSAAAIAAGFRLLLIPEGLLSGGVAGMAMIAGYATGWDIGLLYLVLNAPILLLGWFALGRRFVALSLLTVAATTVFMQLLPMRDLTDERLLAAVFGGVLAGGGTAVSLRYGGSSGGFDVIASVISRYRNWPVGAIVFFLNLIVVSLLGLLNGDWDAVLYSMLSMYLTGRVVDIVHTPHRKVTAFIITQKTDDLAARLLQMPRGVTILKTRGAFTSAERDLLMTVTTRYELAELRKTIRQVDPRAFVNIIQTIDVIGEFRRRNS